MVAILTLPTMMTPLLLKRMCVNAVTAVMDNSIFVAGSTVHIVLSLALDHVQWLKG